MMDLKTLFESIPHIEDVKVDTFIDTLRRIEEFIISEKIDGANLQFGLDENGVFYTTRKKGQQRFYSEKDYPKKFFATGFRSSHLALEKIAEYLKEKGLLRPGDLIEVEILFGEVPNIVPYSGPENQIIFLRPVESSTTLEDLEERMSKMVDLLKGKSVEVAIEAPVTYDGKTIEYEVQRHRWLVDVTPKVDEKIVDRGELKRKLEQKLSVLEDYLKQPSEILPDIFTKFDVLTWPLNRRPSGVSKEDWNDVKQKLKNERKKILNTVKKMQFSIKEDLLNELVRKVGSKFGPPPEEGGWIEGVVIRDPKTGKMVKVVDKEMFLKAKDFVWNIINLLGETGFSKKAKSLLERFIRDIFKVFGIEYQGYQALKKQVLKGEIAIDSLPDNVRRQLIEVVAKYRRMLERLLGIYQKYKNVIKYEIRETGKTLEYKGDIDKKILGAFAEFFAYLDKVENTLRSEKDVAKILKTLFEGRMIISEGGNVFTDASRIKKEEVEPTLKKLSEILSMPYNELRSRAVGSLGFKETSGDIDIIISDDETKKIYEKLVKAIGKENVKRAGKNLHARFPIYNNEGQTDRVVQVDFIYAEDPEWAKTYHTYYPGQKIKNAYKHVIIGAIATYKDRKESKEKTDKGKPVEFYSWRWSPKEGLVYVRRYYNQKPDGTWGKNPKAEIIGPQIKNLDKVAKMLLGPGKTGEDLSKIEELAKAIQKNPHRREILDRVREGLTNIGAPERDIEEVISLLETKYD